jgi:2-polyprenyl-6-methoxyphenol hydroxylase-like FAD-dependent oxidoreductase
MRQVDVVIAGGGLAGSTAAAMLGHAGIRTILVDPHSVYPPDFRCEKLDGPQVRVLQKTGLADAVLRAATPDRECWVARYGRVVDRRPGDQHGILYHDLVNTIRAQIPQNVAVVNAKVVELSTGSDHQRVMLSTGEEIAARLIILANGLNIGLRHTLGIGREVVSPCHSVSIGFDMRPVGRPAFKFPAMTYYAEHTRDRIAYITMFPIGASMRANLMTYRNMQDPWLRQIRQAPEKGLIAVMPGLAPLTGAFAVTGDVKIRPADLYVTTGHRQAGIVLVGDAFATSCPAAGTGTHKVFTDVERLCNVHIPRWLATAGMGAEKIAAFYDDPVKQAADAASTAKAYALRSFSTSDGLSWRARRGVKFLGQLAVGALRQAREHEIVATPTPPGAAAGSEARP